MLYFVHFDLILVCFHCALWFIQLFIIISYISSINYKKKVKEKTKISVIQNHEPLWTVKMTQ